MNLKTGEYYWFRQKREKIWRIGYVGNDPSDNQWLFVESQEPLKIKNMKLNYFDWQEIPRPTNKKKKGDMYGWNERIEYLWKQTKKLGLDYPSDNMLSDMIRDSEFNALMYPEVFARRHGLKWKNGKIVNE